MIKLWLSYLRQGLSQKLPRDRMAGADGHGDMKSNLRHLWPYFKRYWRQGLLGFFLIVFVTLCSFPAPLITRYLVDTVILERQMELLAGTIVLLLSILVVQKLAGVFEEFYFARFEQRITLDIRQDLIARVLRLPKSFFDDSQTGYLMSRLSKDVDGMRWFFSRSLIYTVNNILRFIGGVVLLLYLEWRLSLVILVLIPGLVWCIRYFSDKIHILSHQSMEQMAEVSSRFQESLSEVELIKAYASEDQTEQGLMSALKRTFQISLQQVTVNSLAGLVIHSMPGMARAIVLAVGAVWVIRDQWTLGSLLAYQAYLAYVFGPAQFLASANLQLQEARAALARASALFDIVPEDHLGTGRKVEHLAGEIELRDVSFSYNGSAPVLKDISLRVRAGEKIAIVGPSGVGKTTLMSLLMRFYRPTSGEILFDGRPASDFELSSLRQRIGYVSQQPRLLAGSIVANLLYGNPDADPEQVIEAARVAGIHDFIESLPDGYQTRIGEKGVKLSAGQRQRISIARALIKDTDILILDEPSAALDQSTEKSLFDLLPEMVCRKTMFVVTHRPAAAERTDRVLKLEGQRLIDSGVGLAGIRSDAAIAK
jgi:ABC-type bacteriocin/lantibiotic exporter with double-glycine peptidase domain